MVELLVNLGYGTLFMTLLVSLYGTVAAVVGELRKKPQWVDSARNAMLLTFPLLTVTVLSIVLLLVNNSFQVEYVSSVTSRSMPTYLRITALWGGQPGSLVFWSWLLSMFISGVMLRDWSRDRELLPWVIAVSLITLAFFLMLTVLFENPFVRLWQTNAGAVVSAMFQPAGGQPFIPLDGRGLNPLLRHPGMIIHPPMQYLGFVAFVVPYSFAIAALITGRTDERWIRLTRRWTLWAWLFLSMGLVLGMRWAYDVLGWGGYWGWDPVEVAALLPWLTATPFLHSVMIQEKRGMFKRWNMILVVVTYDVMIFGTFTVRSGVLSSVHSFAQSAIGPLFFAFIALTFAGSMYLLSRRWNDMGSGDHLTSLFSREALFLLNNLLFIGVFIVCFWGLLFPMFTEASGFIGDWFPSLAHIFNGQKVTVGPLFYEQATGPLWLAILLLMGIAPLSAWRASTAKTLGRSLWKPSLVAIALTLAYYLTGVKTWGAILAFGFSTLAVIVTVYEFYQGARARSRRSGANFFIELVRLVKRNQRRYGGYIIHIGIVLMAVGIVGIEMFQSETQATLSLGESVTLDDYTVTYASLAEWNTDDNRSVARAVLNVTKDGQPLGDLYPRRDYFYEAQQAMTIPGVRSTLEEDFYVILVDWQPISTQRATFKLFHNPLINWLWIGSFVLLAGTAIAAWPHPETQDVKRFATTAQDVVKA